MTAFVANTDELRDDQVRTRSSAYAHVLRSLAGRVRYLAELAMGRSIASVAEDPIVPRNPQALYGVDFSGPPFGSAWRHPHLVAGGLKPDTSGAGQWEGHQTYGSVVASSMLILRFRVWIRPHAHGERAPYSRGYPLLRVYQNVGVAVPAFDVTVRCRSSATERVPREGTMTVSTITEATKEPDVYWDLRPGWNDLELELESVSSTPVVLASWSINNTSKRGY